MKVILKAFGVFEKEYDAPIESERQKLYFIHRNKDHLYSMMRDVPDLNTIPDRVLRKAVFEWGGKYEDDMPIYEFKELE